MEVRITLPDAVALSQVISNTNGDRMGFLEADPEIESGIKDDDC